jgi:hypothetical protein
MSQFLLALYDNPADWVTLSPEEIQKAIEKYRAWSEKLRASGKLAGSNKLRDQSGRVMRGAGGRLRVTDGPFSETKEVLGGYFLIDAADYDEAVALCRDHPHLAYGGTIEVREIDQLT